MTDERPAYDAVYFGPPDAPRLSPSIAPERPLWRAIANALGVHRMTPEQLRDADLAMSPRAEVLARLGQPSGASAEAIRELDRLVDEQARRRSAHWSQPLSGDAEYVAQIASTLQLAALGLDLHQGNGGAGINPSDWQPVVDSGMFFIQAYRRRDLWGEPLPAILTDHR
jgi:hypothetical protein